jgi:hypothetical protein
MSNQITRIFTSNASQKHTLSNSNPKGGACPNKDTEFTLTGNFVVENGWLDRNGVRQNVDRQYAYFQGTRNGKDVPAGLSAGIFLRRPFDGFTESEEAVLTPFQKELNDCLSAEDLFDCLAKNGVFGGRKVFVKDIVRHSEKPYGQDTEKPVRYAIFDIK